MQENTKQINKVLTFINREGELLANSVIIEELNKKLQIALNVEELNPYFSQEVNNVLSAWSLSERTNGNKKIVKIIQAALICHGYDVEMITGCFDSKLTNQIKLHEKNLGINPTGIVDGKLLRTLLTNAEYQLDQKGDARMRKMQQDLNSRFQSRTQFDYIPCNGIYSKATQLGIIYGL